MAPILGSLLIVAGLGAFLWTMSFRIRPLLFARADVRWDNPQERGPFACAGPGGDV